MIPESPRKMENYLSWVYEEQKKATVFLNELDKTRIVRNQKPTLQNIVDNTKIKVPTPEKDLSAFTEHKLDSRYH